ncbi:hypothetical protein C8F01DRAFT_357874 [Mycena amicta]|nr:hypothetical protein C8F01DRAFT_357874 [Mycena amicta]
MPPRRKKCQICSTNESKYTCVSPGCAIDYCSLACYKQHKGMALCTQPCPMEAPALEQDNAELALQQDPPLRPLTSLKWPYVPDQSSYPDPLKRDDPKHLQTHQYEAIATSSAIRQVLAAHPSLPGLLTQIDQLRGHEREHALQRALGVGAADISVSKANRGGGGLNDDVLALRALAEAVEGAVRGGQDGVLGLDWE